MKSKLIIVALIIPVLISGVFRLANSNDNFSATLAVIPICLIVLLFFVSTLNFRKCKAEFPELSEGIPVKYSDEENWLKKVLFFPWESTGELKLVGDNIEYLTSSSVAAVTFPNNEIQFEWVGTISCKGSIVWFCIVHDGKRHYFTYDCKLVLYSQELTEILYRKLGNN